MAFQDRQEESLSKILSIMRRVAPAASKSVQRIPVIPAKRAQRLLAPRHLGFRSNKDCAPPGSTKLNLATCESQLRRCSADIEANSVWPSKSASWRFRN